MCVCMCARACVHASLSVYIFVCTVHAVIENVPKVIWTYSLFGLLRKNRVASFGPRNILGCSIQQR